MADIFISYTSSDREWAFWIGQELQALGHTPRIHEWEIGPGGDIAAWMEERHDRADHILCIISENYLSEPYSTWERRAAQWAAATDRPNFAMPVFVEPCKAPTLLSHLKRCNLYGLAEENARTRLAAFLVPPGEPPQPAPFPGGAKISTGQPSTNRSRRFPGKATPLDDADATQLATQSHYDVSLSFSDVDAQWVESLAMQLKAEHGFYVWLDQWHLTTTSWHQEVVQRLEQVHCCAVCIGNATPPAWCRKSPNGLRSQRGLLLCL